MSNDADKQQEKQKLLGRLRTAGELYVILSVCTREPYVVCDQETFDDKVFLFFDMEEAKKEAVSLLKEKIPVTVAKLENKQLLMFYTSLYTMGVNAFSIKDEAGDHLIQLADFVKRANPGKQPDGKVWVENPALHLTALYYMQEQRKRPGCENEPAMKEMQEEIASDFTKGTYIVAVQNEGKAIPLVKIGEDQLFWPLFTDVLEFQKFNKNNAMKPMVIKAEKVPQLLPKEAKGVVFNPLGVNMPLTITKKTKPAAREGAESAAETEVESAAPENGSGAAEAAEKGTRQEQPGNNAAI